MNVYISASWKQRERVRALADRLRASGHDVYDFTDPENRSAVLRRPSREIPPEAFPVAFDPACHDYRDYLERPEWREAVEGNQDALQWCDACVLLLPAGADSHCDWAYAVALGKRTAVVGHPPAGGRTPSHLWADAILRSDDAVPSWLRSLS